MRPPRQNQGFTLIELIVVMAISSLLLLIAISGQSQLRARARFDESINQLMASIDYTRNFATANVSENSTGTNRDAYLAGAAFELDNGHTQGLGELEPIYANVAGGGAITHANLPQSGACPNQADGECFEKFFNFSDDLKLVAFSEAEVLFIHNDENLQVCSQFGAGFLGSLDAVCALPPSGPIQFTLQGSTGLTAVIEIDPQSGFVKRIR